MSLTPEQAAALSAYLFERAGAWYLDPSSDAVRTAGTVLRGLAFLAPVLGTAAAALPAAADVLDARSLVLPTPAGPLVIVGAADRADPARFAEAAVGLAVTAAGLMKVGEVQSIKDYLGSGELRAVREAHVRAARGFVRYLLTGAAPTVDGLVAELVADALLPIGDDEVKLARGSLASAVASIVEENLAPPVRAALDALAWLRQHAPEAIVAEPFKVGA